VPSVASVASGLGLLALALSLPPLVAVLQELLQPAQERETSTKVLSLVTLAVPGAVVGSMTSTEGWAEVPVANLRVAVVPARRGVGLRHG
jgi:hypothetical protein